MKQLSLVQTHLICTAQEGRAAAALPLRLNPWIECGHMAVPGIATHYANHAAPLLPNGLQDTVAARNHRGKAR